MPSSSSEPVAESSLLRKAREAKALTLEQVCGELMAMSVDGKGPTANQLSAWERGTTRTSAKYRRLLADFYARSIIELFSHQDRTLAEQATVRVPDFIVREVIHLHKDLMAAMTDVVVSADRVLLLTGSRSRDKSYLDAVEEALQQKPHLVHYRILYGHPHRQVMKEHLLRLLNIRDPEDRSLGYKTLHLGIADPSRNPERFLVISERKAVVIIPSLNEADAFDSAVVFGPDAAERYLYHGKEAYQGSERIETVEDVKALRVLRPPRHNRQHDE